MKLRIAFAAISSIALLSVSAQAADMAVRAVRAPAPSLFAPVPISMWNGLYIGVNGGGGQFRSHLDHQRLGRFDR
jgi:hypothetical protein